MVAGRASLGSGALAAALTVAYVLFGHYAAATPGVGRWAVLLAAAPMTAAGFGFAREDWRGALLLAFGLAAVAFLVWTWPRLHNPVSWLYFAQHVSINAVLGLLFGRTLLPGRQPLVSTFASLVHPVMTPALTRYTRRVTLAWTLFFAVSALVSIVLFVLAPVAVWSVFANLLALPLVLAMFVIENEVRKRVLPPQDRVGLRATVRAVRAAWRP
jgi:uncharacterized membrane protein